MMRIMDLERMGSIFRWRSGSIRGSLFLTFLDIKKVDSLIFFSVTKEM